MSSYERITVSLHSLSKLIELSGRKISYNQKQVDEAIKIFSSNSFYGNEEIIDNFVRNVEELLTHLEEIKKYASRLEHQEIKKIEDLISVCVQQHFFSYMDSTTSEQVRSKVSEIILYINRELKSQVSAQKRVIVGKPPRGRLFDKVLSDKQRTRTEIQTGKLLNYLDSEEHTLYDKIISSLDYISKHDGRISSDEFHRIAALFVSFFEVIKKELESELHEQILVEIQEAHLEQELAELLKKAPDRLKPTIQKLQEKLFSYLRYDLKDVRKQRHADVAMLKNAWADAESSTHHDDKKIKVNSLIEQKDVKGLIYHFFIDNQTRSYNPIHLVKRTHHMTVDEFYKLVTSVPHHDAYVLNYYSYGYNPFLMEMFSVYSSAHFNAGEFYEVNEVFSISHETLKHIFNQVISSPPEKASGNYWKEIGNRLKMPHTIILCQDRSNYRLFYEVSTKRQKVEVVEATRKSNADKAGHNKYRFRDTTIIHKRALSSFNDMYSPIPDWFVTDWHIDPNHWTKVMRKCIQESVNYLHKQKIFAFSMAEGGAFKGTAIYGSDTDATCYILESQRNGKIEAEAEQVFLSVCRSHNVHFKETLRFHYLPDDKQRWDLSEDYVFKKITSGIEKGAYIYDGHKEHLMTAPKVIDLNKSKEKMRLVFI